MDTFYVIVLSVSTALLILILTYFGIVMRNAKNSTSYPPQPPSTCPDYWSLSPDGKTCQIPVESAKNAGNVYVGSSLMLPVSAPGQTSTTIDFSDAGWSAGASSSLCNRKVWAGVNSVMWDGVSNYNGC